jgi:K(+)-stimulated pyrophosphate-energized sodium pump
MVVGYIELADASKTVISGLSIFYTTLIGLILTAAMVVITEYYTSTEYAPVKQIAEASTT